MLTRLLAIILALATMQDSGVLRVRVLLNDVIGAATPIPRVMLLISDNPATTEPRRVRTGNDGSVEIRLKPGNYTIESDQPIAFGGNTYSWTQMIDVRPGVETVLDLVPGNAEVHTGGAAGNPTAIDASSASILARWQDSVVEIWTPIVHAAGFVVDARGMIASSHRAIGDATTVEIEMATRAGRVKVPGKVLQSDRLTGAAMIWVDPAAIASIPPLDVKCQTTDSVVAAPYKAVFTTLTASMFSSKALVGGSVTAHNEQAIFLDAQFPRDATGGPVFADTGELAGISAIADSDDGSRVGQPFVVPMTALCRTLLAAEKKMTGPPPPATHLPLEPSRTARVYGLKSTARTKSTPIGLSGSTFDITLMTTTMAQDLGKTDARCDPVNWMDYMRDAPEMTLIRVSPKFEESFWKTLARGAAMTQGVTLPPLRNFTSRFLKMQVFCGDTEVTPIHPFIVERQLQNNAVMREGLYVFPLDAFGAQCSSVRLLMYSEKEPNKPESKTIDPKLFEQLK